MRSNRTALLLSILMINVFVAGCGSGTTTVSTTPQLPTPTFSPSGGTFTTTQMVAVTDANASAAMYYTTDGTTPTSSSVRYSGAITVSSSKTLKALAVLANFLDSAIASAPFTLNTTPLPTPVFSPGGGAFAIGQTVTITDANASAAIYYTTDGSTPTVGSLRYGGGIAVSSSTTLKSIAVLTNFPNSAVASASYDINPVSPTVTLSASARAVTQGAGVTLTWAVSNATTCSATATDGSWNNQISAASGTGSVLPRSPGVQRFTLTCLNGNLSASATAAVAVSTGATSCLDVIVPLYIYPYSAPGVEVPDWINVVADNFASKGRQRFIIAGASLGYTSPYDINYYNAIASVKAKGASALVYVHTVGDLTKSTALISLTDVEADVHNQVSFYKGAGIIGVFVDEVQGTPGNMPYYSTLLNYIVQQLPNATVVFNIGLTAPTTGGAYVSTAPYANITVPAGARLILNIQEGYYSAFPVAGSDSSRNWMFDYPASKFSIILHTMNDASQVLDAVDNTIRSNVGTAFFTDRAFQNGPYTGLPSTAFFSTLTTITNNGCPF